MTITKKHIGSYFSAEVIHGNIVLFVLNKNIKVGVEELQEAIDCQQKLMEGKSFHSILDMTNTKNVVSRAAGEIAKEYDQNTEQKLSQSVIVNSVGKSMQIGIFRKAYGSENIPFKTFSTLENALEWIHQLEE